MIPRGVVVAGGVAVVAGGAVYVFQPEAASDRAVASAETDIRWVVEGGERVDRSASSPLAIRDPLNALPASGRSGTLDARLASAVEPAPDPFDVSRSSRTTFVPDPELPSSFAAPPSAPFVSGLKDPASDTALAPLDGGSSLGVTAIADQDRPLPLEAAALAPALSANGGARPVAIGRHRIKDGETLEQIAIENYGDPALAGFLFERNRRILKYPDLLPVGKEIVLYAPPAELPAGEPLASAVSPAASPKSTLPGVQTPDLAPLD